MSHVCTFCGAKLSTLSALTNHVKRARYCLSKRVTPEKVNDCLFSCTGCMKTFSSRQTYDRHLEICVKYCVNTAISSLSKIHDETVKNLSKSLIIQEAVNQKLEQRIREQNDSVSVLQDKLENIAIKGVMKSTTTNKTTNKVSILAPLDLSQERLKDLVEANFTNAHLLEGQKGVARFTVEHVIKDKDGKLRYICTDPARHTFRFKDGDTEIKDVRGKRLSTALAPPVMDKTGRLGMQAIKENPEMFCIYSNSQQSIRDMRNDDAEFRGELASMTG
jgi:hypothetical protein